MRGLVLLIWAAAALADAYPEGRSVQTIEGTETALLVPEGLSAERRGSLVILLHGAGDNGPNLVNALAPWQREGYVVCAPSATEGTWDPGDLAKAKRIALHLLKTLPIDPTRIHAVGFSNGGWNLAPIAFDEDLKPVSATWIAAGYNGGGIAAAAGSVSLSGNAKITGNTADTLLLGSLGGGIWSCGGAVVTGVTPSNVRQNAPDDVASC